MKTPHLDALARGSMNFSNAVSRCPVCAPYRASLMTGQHPLTHGVFVNDVAPGSGAVGMAEAFAAEGYETAYIGKWHLDGRGRSARIPPERRMGFQHWQALECTHAYNHSAYYDGNAMRPSFWEGYDAFAQTQAAIDFIKSRRKEAPFLLVLSWGPPHTPYETAPEEFRALYDPKSLVLRPNVPPECAEQARKDLAGYYAHCTALDHGVGLLQAAIKAAAIENDTVFVFTSDHGDMLGSQGESQKQRPWDESIRVPFLLKYPGLPGWRPGRTEELIDAPDIMPTLLGLCGLPIPHTVEGTDFSPAVNRRPVAAGRDAFLSCPHPFGQWSAAHQGGREYRGLRTARHTYIRDLNGPWLLYDNTKDPYQLKNLVQDPASAPLLHELDVRLQARLEKQGDRFEPGSSYLEKWGYIVDANGAVPYTP